MLSVIIPTLNEAEALPRLLTDLSEQQDLTMEIIVVDGGSTDATRDVPARFCAGLVTSEAGRGLQMNAGAARAGQELLLFLHADSRLTYPRQLADACEM